MNSLSALLRTRVATLLFITSALGQPALAATPGQAEAGSAPQVQPDVRLEAGDETQGPLDEASETQRKFIGLMERIAWLRTEIEQKSAERQTADPSRLQMVQARIDRLLDEYFEKTSAASALFLENMGVLTDLDDDRQQLTRAITDVPKLIVEEIRQVKLVPPLASPEKPAAEQAAQLAAMKIQVARVGHLTDMAIKINDFAAQLGLDTAQVDAALRQRIEFLAASTSTYLDLAIGDADALRFQGASLPSDTELAAKIIIAERHVAVAADYLSRLATQMDLLEMDAAEYNAQVIAATGALTSDIFDLKVLGDLTADFFTGIVDWLSDNSGPMFFKILVFLAIILVTWKVARLAQTLTEKALGNQGLRLSQLLQRMIVATTRSIILVLGLLMALSQLGISLGPLLAGLGIAGFILGFALQDSLSNFASGLMILIYRPFDVEDVVEVSGAFGTVKHMSLVNTNIVTFDNQTLVVPNNQIWQNVIKNVTAQRTRRVDMVFGVSYADDIEKTERVLKDVVTSNQRVLPEPQPVIRLHELADSSVNFVVRPWVETVDYWDAYWEITRAVKLRFDEEGISIPFPQRDVHLFQTAPPDVNRTAV